MWIQTWIALALFVGSCANFFKNPNFESNKFSVNDGWYCRGCTIQQSSEHFEGHHSAKVSHRQDGTWSSISQNVKVPAHAKLQLKIKIKLLNRVPGFMYHDVYVRMYSETSNGHHYANISHVNFMQAETEWQEVGGIFGGPGYVHLARLDILIREKDVDYLVDAASLTELPAWPKNWKDEANHRIDQIRKANIHISLANSVQGHGYSVEVQQTKSEFGFGSMVKSWLWSRSSESKYRKFFLDTFEWTVPETGLKWTTIEKTKGHENFAAMKALDDMRKHGIKVRAHTMFWSNVPDWLSKMSGNGLKQEMEKHLKSCVAHTKGKVQHWDVYNENLHYDFFPRKLHDPNITSWMYREVHRQDPHVKLFVNEWGVVNSQRFTTAYYNKIKFLLDSNVPLDGIGIQSHLGGSADLQVLKARLDLLARTGLPMWITELRFAETNAHKKAQALEDVFRFYFSYPSIEGIMLWGFTPGMSEPRGALVDKNMVPNEAGRKLQHLLRNEWRTHETHNVPSHTSSMTVRGFKGEYILRLKKGSHVVQQKTFTLGKNGANVQIKSPGSVLIG